MDAETARNYLTGILNKNLRVYTSDDRLFWGSLKCTDHDKNIVLAHTYEYRQPSSREREKAAEKADGETVKVNMTSRYLGLVVIPGQHIKKMEVEQFASQMRNENVIQRKE
ncbi:LSM domain protein [Fusarium beomiforme]|uniref:LSM domain protein n=1 Tax=Fusarium beomiforme TaxID=44412 RepID=A0A9P5AI94_9HYPO|nr:LSM domain protein [Fusarium beomiforme]